MAEPIITPEQLAEIALGAAEITVDGQTVKTHSLKDLKSLAEAAATDSAASNKQRGLRFTKLVPPGATS